MKNEIKSPGAVAGPPVSGHERSRDLLAQRFVDMALSASLPRFPEDGVSLYSLAPWWTHWPVSPRRSVLEPHGAAVYPVTVGGWLPLIQGCDPREALFAGQLPIYRRDRAAGEWLCWAEEAGGRDSGGWAPLLPVMEYLLDGESREFRVSAWSRLLRSGFDNEGDFRGGSDHHALSLLAAVGRSGLSELAPAVAVVLRDNDAEMVLAALACLARLGVPSAEFPAEQILGLVHPDQVGTARAALAFMETGDPDLAAQLLGVAGWCERRQAVRLVDSVLVRGPAGECAGEMWLDGLLDVLMHLLSEESDDDIVRALAGPLGGVLRRGDEPMAGRVLDEVINHRDDTRVETLLNALLSAGAGGLHPWQLESLRPQVTPLGSGPRRALNRVLGMAGAATDTPADWLQAGVVLLLQERSVVLPVHVRTWFDDPGSHPDVALAWLLAKPDSPLAATYCAACLDSCPQLAVHLESVWRDAMEKPEVEAAMTAGCLLAGAPYAVGLDPVECRCSLGTEIGGVLPETPMMVGTLLGIMLTRSGALEQHARRLLSHTGEASRLLVGQCLFHTSRNLNPFGYRGKELPLFGVSCRPLDRGDDCPGLLLAIADGAAPAASEPSVVLAALALPVGVGLKWLERVLNWDSPEAVARFEESIPLGELLPAFLRASASLEPKKRICALRLLAAAAPRLRGVDQLDLLHQRVIYLAGEEDEKVRAEAVLAAQAMGIEARLPENPPAIRAEVSQRPAPGMDSSGVDNEIEQLLRELNSSMEEN